MNFDKPVSLIDPGNIKVEALARMPFDKCDFTVDEVASSIPSTGLDNAPACAGEPHADRSHKICDAHIWTWHGTNGFDSGHPCPSG